MRGENQKMGRLDDPGTGGDFDDTAGGGGRYAGAGKSDLPDL